MDTTDLSGRVHDLGSRSSATATHTAWLVHDIRTMQAKADHVLRPKLREMTELSRDGTDSAVTAGNRKWDQKCLLDPCM